MMATRQFPTKTISTALTEVQYGLSLAASAKGNYPIVGMKDIRDGRIHVDESIRVELDDETAERFLLRTGDVLLNRTNSNELVGKCAIFDGGTPAVFASYLVRLKFDEKSLLPAFANYFLNSEYGQAQLKVLSTRAVSQANINPTTFRKHFAIPFPKLDEQRRIVCVLDAAKQLENLSDEVYRKRRALAAAKFVEVTKAAGGDSVKLSDIVSINADSLPNSTDPDREIQYFDVSSDGDHEVSGRMRFSQAPSRARRLAEAGDVVYATIRPLLRRLFIAEDRPDAVYSTGYAVMSGPEDITRYLYHALTTEVVERQIHAFSTGTGYPAISAGDLGDVKVRLPGKGARIAIANMADAMFKQASIHRQIAEGCGLGHRGLMQKLLTGQWRLTRDLPGMEPAHV